ncbi:coiled-coil domain-containing protein [Puerhibacterium puerhi]|uniref:hypothetical protein n=1 Tax=Puerhibacterium puerhi TaxID=2692623 RepID=UPI001357B0BC|nr:hypothetical protein [Puerhibacterium puerhi]
MADTPYQELQGSPALVASKARKYIEIADAIQRSTSALKKISDEIETKSLAMDETREKAEKVRESIEKAQDRYRETGSALQDYATALRAAKDDAHSAILEIDKAEAELAVARTAQHNAERHESGLPATATPQEAVEARTASSRAGDRVSDAEGDLAYWQGRWREASEAKDSAARTAVGRIEEVVTGKNTHGLKDGTWDKVTKAWDSFYELAKVVCDVAGFLAIFFSWVPVLGQALLILAAAGAILAVVEAAMKWSKGEGSFWGVLGAAGLAALSLFGGKAISSIAQYSKARMIVQTSARMSGSTARATFGRSAITSARKVFAQTTGQRVTEVIKSPFVRSTTDKAVAGMFRSGSYGHGFRTLFPNPFTGSGMRALFTNDDVSDMLRIMNTDGIRMDTVSTVTSSVAVGLAYANNAYAQGKNLVDFATEAAAGDSGQAAKPGADIATSPFGGPYGKIVGYGAQLIDNPTDDAVTVP